MLPIPQNRVELCAQCSGGPKSAVPRAHARDHAEELVAADEQRPPRDGRPAVAQLAERERRGVAV